jgi:ribosomal protein L9
MNDPIVDEVRRIRDAHAARFNYDLDAIYQDIKEQERKSGRTFVSLTRENIAPEKTTRRSGSTE